MVVKTALSLSFPDEQALPLLTASPDPGNAQNAVPKWAGGDHHAPGAMDGAEDDRAGLHRSRRGSVRRSRMASRRWAIPLPEWAIADGSPLHLVNGAGHPGGSTADGVPLRASS